ncbi:hypothetical protein AHiyo4_39880 [Arthrobacter sp. Hiyo4]|nr:hypothetical protein AHiyo4_39880 [Arthrobacter sp. Hiyo4]
MASDLRNIEFLGKVSARFIPKKTDNLVPEVECFIGQEFVWQNIGECDGATQWSPVGPDRNALPPFVWVPTEDLVQV